MNLATRIKALESQARRLEPRPEERSEMTRRVTEYASTFLDRIEDAPVFVPDHNHGRGLYAAPISEDPITVDEALKLIRDNVDEPGLNPASGGHLGYIPGGGIYPAALGDYLAAVSNNFAGIYYVAPGAVRMEHMLVRWMSDLIGYPAGAGGDLASGGSIANFIGVVTARDAAGVRARDIERIVVYVTRHTHHSVDKALRIAGMDECVHRYVDLDDRYRMNAEHLASAIAADRKSGLKPWLIVAAAGTTDVGAVDPLEHIGDIAAKNDVWLHVDASYGGFFRLCEEGRSILRGMDAAHSVVMDPHKGLFLPYGCGAVLVKERSKLQAAHAYQASYMQDADEAQDEYSPADHSPELTRHYRGMRLWLPLKLFGVAPFRACLEEKLLLARHFYEEIQTIDGFEVGPAPDLSVVTYRYVPKRGNADDFNRKLVQAVQRDGRVFITSTLIDGRFTLRLAVLSFRTHLDRIEYALDILRRKSREIAAMS